MRSAPTWRNPIGILALCLGLALYGIVAITLVEPLIADWSVLAQTPVYVVLGVIWLLPLRRFLIWMETGRWSPPAQD